MKAVALHTTAADFKGQRHQPGDGRLSVVEAGVETGHLGHARQACPDRGDGCQIAGLVEGRQRYQFAEFRHQCGGDDGRSLVVWTAVNHPVTHTKQSRAAARVPQGSLQCVECGANSLCLPTRLGLPVLPTGPAVDAELQAR